MPLTWAQVRGDLDPKRYTVRTVPALLGKTKAWEGYDEAASSIKAAIEETWRQSSSMRAVIPGRANARARNFQYPRIANMDSGPRPSARFPE